MPQNAHQLLAIFVTATLHNKQKQEPSLRKHNQNPEDINRRTNYRFFVLIMQGK